MPLHLELPSRKDARFTLRVSGCGWGASPCRRAVPGKGARAMNGNVELITRIAAGGPRSAASSATSATGIAARWDSAPTSSS